MVKTCPKCHYQRVASDTAPDWQCPQCGVAYNKVGTTPRPSVRVQDDGVPSVAPRIRKQTVVVVVLLMSLAGFGIWKNTRSGVPEQTVSTRFDAAKKAFQADDFQKATQEFTALAEQGDAKAQYYLGRIYALDWRRTGFDGQGASQPADRKKSVYWYTKAAEHGEMLAQLELGKLFASNLGGGSDPYGDSAKWYRMAAEQGDAEAQYAMGSNYEQGRGVVKDSTQALLWYRAAADQGHAGALYGLGMLYAKGNGVTGNAFTAYQYLHLAAARNELNPGVAGAFWAKRDSEEIGRTLSAAERAQADALVASWQPGAPLPR